MHTLFLIAKKGRVADVAEAASVGGLLAEYEKKLEDGRRTRSDLRKRLKTASLQRASHYSPHGALRRNLLPKRVI